RNSSSKSLQKTAKWAHKKIFISQKLPTIIQKFALLIKSKKRNGLISDYIIVLYITQNLKYRNSSNQAI
ncbi:MAG: hypothetical protein IKO26_04395, partial [Paludibacteraceae bacterium]|nr:hypothetical protein [Paludibacteraceae bacterium]